MGKIYILNLNNNQEEYAMALDFIKAIEDKNSGSLGDRKNTIWKVSKRISISIGNMQSNISPRYLEQPISVSDKGNISPESIQNKHSFTEMELENLGRKYKNIRYHLRIHFEDSKNELIHMQYLAMLLKKVSKYFINEKESEDKELRKYLTVFMVPTTGDIYPFKNKNGKIDYDTYAYTSRYLRLLSKRFIGVIYGVDEISNQPIVTSLDFRRNKKCETCFPLTIIDQKVYDFLFIISITDILDSLFSLNKNGRFGKSRDENPMIALKDYIAETDLYRIRGVASGEECSEILHFMKSHENVSLMEFSLFAFMLSMKKTGERLYNIEEKYVNIWNLAHEISQGLKQVAQNAIQHTESRECFFSFYLHEKENKEDSGGVIDKIIKMYPNTNFNASEGESALEIFVSDLNDKEDMIDNFISNLEYERNMRVNGKVIDELSGHLELMKRRDKLAIRNFFSVYTPEDARNEWKYFRQEDLIAHIGLSQFAQTAKKCKASVKVISSKYSELTDEKKFFYRAYGNVHALDSSRTRSQWKSISVIPGTQFSILIPVQYWDETDSMGIGQLKQHNCVAENYKSFASYLDCCEKRNTIQLKERGINSWNTDILDAKRKYRLVQNWKIYWESKFEENIKTIKTDSNNDDKKVYARYVFNYDFNEVSASSYFNDEDRIEVCLKGIISALGTGENLGEPFLIALTNLPGGFIEIFRKISVQLSVKQFPSGVQLFLHEKENGGEKSKRAVMLGNDFSQAIYNAYILSMEHGVEGFDKNDCEDAIEIKTTLISGLNMEEEKHEHKLTGVCPFDVILCCSEKEKRSFFELQLKDMAEGSLDEELIGYKLNDTHMRLGSKVHIESFYEMSFLFYRTTIANRLAFNILRQIKEEKSIDIVNDNVLFYGYASYSKAVLTSINEILREYRKIYLGNEECIQKDKIAIASFQHNLMLESEETQMYYDLPSKIFPGSVGVDNHLRLQEVINVIQIVPISSTLTTFDKMWKRFMGSVVEKDKAKICLAGNYTVFWVVDQNGDLKKGLPSNIEAKYWKKVVDHKIKTKLPVLTNAYNMDIHFLIRSAVVWHDPLKCELCYPEYVINEVPLVETDPTSTVPTQQIRYQGYQFTGNKELLDESYDRFVKLQKCVLYDHISRRQNHYQFYIDTQQYFYNVKDMVKDWLEDLSRELLFETREPVLHIIFSPEHNTNIGFVQYVNTYYFNGMAEIVSINVDKQFRSNFICEHAAIKRMIEELHRDRRDMKSRPVKFYFVDDTIITGDTLEKANGLLHSLVPSNEYPVNLFSKIFVLMDRLSNETKQMYVDDPNQNFVAFLHVDVSNVRTHGDSCIGCKLEQDALKLYKRSATRNMAQYWYQKLYDYRKKAYDNKEDIATINKEKSYQMLLFSHILQNVLVKQGRCYRLGDSFDVVLNLSLWLLNAEGYANVDIYGYNEFLGQMRNMNGVRVLLKTVCRPFFSYDFKIKRQLYTFFIFLTELMFGEKSQDIVPEALKGNEHILNLFDNDRVPKMEELEQNIRKNLSNKKESELDFLKDYLFESLTDMGSTYAMRMQTLKKVYAYIEDEGRNFSEEEKIVFWNSYEVNIHRLVTGNADESRELWLEYMYMTGREYGDFLKEYSENKKPDYEPLFFYSAIAEADLTSPKEKHFYQFCHNLFLQNTGINFDELEEKSDALQSFTSVDGDFLRDYWRQMRNLDSFMNPLLNEGEWEESYTESERRLFDLLNNKDIEKMGQSVNQWYEEFLNEIVGVIGEKYNIEMKDINIAMLTETKGDKECENHIQLLDIVKENINSSKVGISETRYYIKERIVNALKDNGLFNLEQNGYTISKGSILKGERRPYIIAFIDNPGNTKKTIYERRLTRVFLYISISEGNEEQKTQLLLRLILRDVLMYRNRILRFLEKDFAGEIYASYAHKIGEKNILSHEKAHSHNTTADDEISLEIFQGIKTFKDGSDYEELDRGTASDWLLLRNYTNGQIAKIFNRSFHDSKDGQLVLNTPMLYIPRDSMNYGGNVFKQKLVRFSELNLRNENRDLSDERFRLLNKIIDIQYDEAMNDAKFIQGSEGQYYNFEYFKCILIDIMISAIKFKSDRSNYLTRIDRFLEINRKLDHEVYKWNTDDKDIMELVKGLKESRCHIRIFREKSPISGIDYLVIQNPVDKIANRLKNWEEQNQIILHRLEDPLDYADGHMSLLTIKRYIENLDETYRLRCVFQYKAFEVDGKEKLFFESRLPILKREVNK